MGKRNLHGKAYYTCDWTGIPMAASNAYMPVFKGGKMAKKGSYCNWEAVCAHARKLFGDDDMSVEAFEKLTEHVEEVTGTFPLQDYKGSDDPLHFSQLDHFGGPLTPLAWAATCARQLPPISAVKITGSGEVMDVLLTAEGDSYPFAKYLTTPYMLPDDKRMELAKVEVKRAKLKGRDLCVFYYPDRNGLARNAAVSRMLKVEVYGDVLLVAKTREANHWKHTRYVGFTPASYATIFEKKKRTAPAKPAAAIEPAEWKELLGEMNTALTDFEASVSKGAQEPGELARGAVMPPATGKELVVAATALGYAQPC